MVLNEFITTAVLTYIPFKQPIDCSMDIHNKVFFLLITDSGSHDPAIARLPVNLV